MKRHLYILLAALAFAACEPTTTTPDVAFNFSVVEVTTTEDSASVDVIEPYITVDGTKYEGATIYLEYWLEGNDTDIVTVRDYEAKESGGHLIFTLHGLTPSTRYLASVVLDGGAEYGLMKCEPFPIVTKEHIPTCEISCNTAVDAKGLFATLKLSDVAYLVDGESVAIANLKVEYAPKESNPKWVVIDIEGSKLSDGKEDVAIPADGEEYLEENSSYLYRVTITPEDEAFEAMATDDMLFRTSYAKVTADISKPTLKFAEGMLNIEVASVAVYYDELYLASYPYCDYYIHLREKGDSEWQEFAAELTLYGMKLTIAAEELKEGSTYEVAGVVIAGAKHNKCMSEIASIEIPKPEHPTPDRPEGGSSDTTELKGEWKLTEWRDSEPSFDIYLSISSDGVVGLWQRLTSREWELYYSTVIYEDGTLWGTYTDGIDWGASYYVTITGDKMVWTDTMDSSDISVYTRTELPAELPVAESVATRSNTRERFL